MKPLIAAEQLAERLDDPLLRIADVRWYLSDYARGRREYENGHLPAAVFVDVDSELTAPPGEGRHPLPDPSEFSRRLSRLGIGSEHLVVAYDASGGAIAARLWWMLDDLGHRGVVVLDGGMTAWVEAGLPLTTEVPSYPPSELRVAAQWSKVIDRQRLRQRLGDVLLLDARAPERYRGQVEPIDPVAGHIPTAVNAPLTGNLDKEGRFLDPVELRDRFEALGTTPTQVVVHCGSGVNSCHLALAMRVAGLPDPVLYAGSYSDWTRAGFPVVSGAEPGEP